MAKRRTLKRDIGYVAGDLFTDVLVTRMLVPGLDQEQSDLLLGRILDMQEEFVRRAGTPDAKENKKLVRKYYKKLEEDLEKEAKSICDSLEAMVKAAQV